MRKQLVSWQWQAYPDNHTTRTNLALHIVSNPLFILGFATLVLGGFFIGVYALFGLAAMAIAIALQGRGHKLETTAPIPFTGPDDFVSRFFVEQLVNFPRFVLSGGWLRAWSLAKPEPKASEKRR